MTSWVTENWGYKLFALALSTALWLVVVEEPEVTTSLAAPVQYRNIPRDLEMVSSVSDRVHLEVRGPANKLTQMSLADAVVVIDLSGVNRAGERTFPVNAASINLPSGVRVDRAVPAQVRLQFDRRLVREVPVSIQIGTPPPAGFEIASQTAEPASLRVVGPEGRVREVTSIATDRVDLGEITGSEEFSVHAFTGDPQVRIEGDSRIQVRIRLRKIGAGTTN